MPEYQIRWITDGIAVSCAPRSHGDLEMIQKAGIEAIINLCAECYDLHESEKRAGFDVLYLPIPDECAPQMAELEEAVSWLDTQVASGGKVLVHCRFGIGRTGTLVAAYLLCKGFSIRTALRKMKHTPAMPMSAEQWGRLKDYSDSLGIPVSEVEDAEDTAEGATDTFFKKWESMLTWFK